MKKVEVNIIEILWKGPFNTSEVDVMNGVNDIGLYQIYGSHDTHGSNVLLYIGKTTKQTFGKRFVQHKDDWMKWEPSNMEIYLGRLCDVKDLGKEIDIAEKLLIYYGSPPYNSYNLIRYDGIPDVLILNIGRKNRIPYAITSLIDQSEYWE